MAHVPPGAWIIAYGRLDRGWIESDSHFNHRPKGRGPLDRKRLSCELVRSTLRKVLCVLADLSLRHPTKLLD